MTSENSTTKQPESGRKIFKRLLKIAFIFFLLLVVLLSSIFLILRIVVSGNGLRTFVEARLASELKQDVKIQAIDLSWLRGFEISELVIWDDPVISPDEFIHLEKMKFDIDFLKLLFLDIDLEFELDGLTVNLLRGRDGITNIEYLASKLGSEEEKPPEEKKITDETLVLPDLSKFAFVLPVDIKASVNIKNVTIEFDDKSTGKKAGVKDFAFTVDIPKIAGSPIKVGLKTAILIDEKKISDSFINLSLENLFDDKRNLTLSMASLVIDGEFPGIQISTRGAHKEKKLVTKIEINLPELYNPIKGVLPEEIAEMTILGDVNTEISLSARDSEHAVLKTIVSGEEISVEGGVLKRGDKKFKTEAISFRLENIAAFVPGNGNIEDINGSFSLLRQTKISWKGSVKSAFSPASFIDLKIRPVTVNLSEILSIADPLIPGLLPEDLPRDTIRDLYESLLAKKNNNREEVNLNINEISVTLTPEDGKGIVQLDDLDFRIPKVDFKIKIPEQEKKQENKDLAKNRETYNKKKNKKEKILKIEMDDFTCKINEVRSELSDFFPETLQVATGLSVKSFKVSGDQDISLTTLRIPEVLINIEGLRKSENPLAKLSAEIDLKQSLEIKKITIPELLSLNNIKENIDLKISLPEKTCVRASIKDFNMSLSPYLNDLENTGPLRTNVNLNGWMKAFHLKTIEPPDADISGFEANVLMDDILKAEFSAMAQKSGEQGFLVTGSSEVDLKAFTEKIISRFVKGLMLTGKNISAVKLAGRAPDEKEFETLVSGKIPGKEDFRFINSLSLKTGIYDSSLVFRVEEKKDQEIRVKSINGLPLFDYCFYGKNGKGVFNGNLQIESIEGLPSLNPGKIDSIKIDYKGSHDFIHEFKLSQNLAVTPLNIRESINFTLYGFNRIIDKKLFKPDIKWLKYLGGTLSGDLAVLPDSDWSKLVENIDIKGSLNSGLNLYLTEKSRIGGNLSSDIKNLNLSIGEFVSIHDMNTDIKINKNYNLIALQQNRLFDKDKAPLSVSVLNPDSFTESSGGNVSAENFFSQIRDRYKVNPSVSVKSIAPKMLPFPLEIKDTATLFNLKQGLPVVDYFKTDIIGGTIIGGFSIVSGKEGFSLKFNTDFSGIDPGRLFPEKSKGIKPIDREVSGSVTVIIPIRKSLDKILNTIKIDLKITDIGSRFLARILFSLDPGESNESILLQRKLLKLGSPKWVRLSVNEGALSVKGEVDLAGATIAMPAIDGIHFASLPGLKKYQGQMGDIIRLINILEILNSDAIDTGSDYDKLEFVKTGIEKRLF